MLQEIFTAFSLGKKVLKSLADLRRDAESFRSGTANANVHSAQLEALGKRTETLESLAREQRFAIQELEHGVKDASSAAEALANRVGTIFWIALVGIILGVIALTFSILVMTHAIR
jgi:cytochrome c biogenesis protein ResB